MTSTRLMIFFLDQASSDEGVPLSGEEETSSKYSYHHRRLPTHVYKEYLPSTIYRTGEARSVRVCIESISRKRIFTFFLLEYNGWHSSIPSCNVSETSFIWNDTFTSSNECFSRTSCTNE